MKTTGKPDDAWSRFALSIFRANGLLMAAGETVTGPLGQSSARWQVLGRAGYQPQTVAYMARDMGHARQGVQRIADILAKEGLISYKAHPTDRRTKLVELTPEGIKVLTAIYMRQMDWSERVMSKLDQAHIIEIADAIETIGDTLETEVKANSKANKNTFK